jgi:hypothetical protein
MSITETDEDTGVYLARRLREGRVKLEITEGTTA